MKNQRTKNEKQAESVGAKASDNSHVSTRKSVPKPADSKKKSGAKAKERKPAKAAPTRRDLMALKPVRNPLLEWSEEDGQIILTIRRSKDWKTRLVLIFTQVPEVRRVVLDPIGAHVWRMSDGATTFETIARSLAKEFKLMPREAELSLQQFFKELGRRGYIVFAK